MNRPDIAVTTRSAAPDDAHAIASVNVASWRAAYSGLMPDAYLDALSVDEQAARWERGLRTDPGRGRRTVVAEDADGAIVGYATVGPDEEPGVGLLMLMYVAPSHWGRGAGRALLAAARAELRALGYERCALWVLEANARARRFYERDGWAADGTSRVDDYGGVGLRAVRHATEV